MLDVESGRDVKAFDCSILEALAAPSSRPATAAAAATCGPLVRMLHRS
jgi:hypothetical protein